MNTVTLTGYMAWKPNLNQAGTLSNGSLVIQKPFQFRRGRESEYVPLVWIGESRAKFSTQFEKGDHVEVLGFLQSYRNSKGFIEVSVGVLSCSYCGRRSQANPLNVRELLDQDDPELQNQHTEETPSQEPLTAADVGTEASSLTTDEKTIEKKTRKGAKKATTPKVKRYQPPEDLPGIDYQPFS